VKKAVHVWLAAQLKRSVHEGIRKLMQREPTALKIKEAMLTNYVNVSFLFVLK
jgi:hypothetical protein